MYRISKTYALHHLAESFQVDHTVMSDSLKSGQRKQHFIKSSMLHESARAGLKQWGVWALAGSVTNTEVLHAVRRMAWLSAANGQRADVTVGATEISSGGTTYSTFGWDSEWWLRSVADCGRFSLPKSPTATSKSHLLLTHRVAGGVSCCFDLSSSHSPAEGASS